MWDATIFFLVMTSFIVFAYAAKLCRFKGTKLKIRMIYALAISLFFTLYFLWITKGDAEIIEKGLLVGGLAAIPFATFTKWWMDNDGVKSALDSSSKKVITVESMLSPPPRLLRESEVGFLNIVGTDEKLVACDNASDPAPGNCR